MLTNLHELLNDEDKEMQKIAEDEKKCFVDKINVIDEQLEEALLNIGSNDDHNAVILEINAGNTKVGIMNSQNI
ncbi:PCRF domain [Popillia japonica]|uniref:PCRF domain n=1 Tax=Popillia japonica TaxID=7064 RepID=A0AAW1N2R1_POPJA